MTSGDLVDWGGVAGVGGEEASRPVTTVQDCDSVKGPDVFQGPLGQFPAMFAATGRWTIDNLVRGDKKQLF